MGISYISTTQYPKPGSSFPQAPVRPSGPISAKRADLKYGQEAQTPVNPAVVYHNDARVAPVTELLVDPITRKRYDINTPFDDKLMRLNAWGKAKEGFRKNFVALPTTIAQGLKGDNRFTFSDYLDVTSIPYYLGGAFLAVSFLAGRDKINASRQAVGVGLYYLGALAATKGIDAFYKATTGVDLNLRFHRANGDVERVFSSTDFPRFDLLEERDYRRMMKRLGVPEDVSDPKREVQDQVRNIISASRADKLILGNLLAAVGAGYIARSDAWGNTFTGWGQLKPLFKTGGREGGLLERLGKAKDIIGPKFSEPLKEAFLTNPNKTMRYGILGGSAALISMIIVHSWAASRRGERRFESPFITNLSPALAPEQSPLTAALQQHLPGGQVNKLPRKGVFDIAQRMESGKPSTPFNAAMTPMPFPPKLPLPAFQSPPPEQPFQPKGGLMVDGSPGGSFR